MGGIYNSWADSAASKSSAAPQGFSGCAVAASASVLLYICIAPRSPNRSLFISRCHESTRFGVTPAMPAFVSEPATIKRASRFFTLPLISSVTVAATTARHAARWECVPPPPFFTLANSEFPLQSRPEPQVPLIENFSFQEYMKPDHIPLPKRADPPRVARQIKPSVVEFQCHKDWQEIHKIYKVLEIMIFSC